jgi:hypothetical protein
MAHHCLITLFLLSSVALAQELDTYKAIQSLSVPVRTSINRFLLDKSQTLDLSGVNITTQDAQTVWGLSTEFHEFTLLNISNNFMEDLTFGFFVQVVASFELDIFDISFNRITTWGLTLFVRSLSNKHSEMKVFLSNNLIDTGGMFLCVTFMLSEIQKSPWFYPIFPKFYGNSSSLDGYIYSPNDVFGKAPVEIPDIILKKGLDSVTNFFIVYGKDLAWAQVLHAQSRAGIFMLIFMMICLIAFCCSGITLHSPPGYLNRLCSKRY